MYIYIYICKCKCGLWPRSHSSRLKAQCKNLKEQDFIRGCNRALGSRQSPYAIAAIARGDQEAGLPRR